jgi:tetratricopeptide (TPR) repeat protein
MKRPQLLSAGSVSRMRKAAEECWARKDFPQAIEILQRASRLDPANATLLVELGRLQGLRYDYTAAIQSFDKAVRVAPRKAETLALAGEKSCEFASSKLAEDYFERALAQKDVTPETFSKLAELYERKRRVEEASRLVDRALQLNGACAPALLVRARLDRQAGRLEAAERLLRSIVANADRVIRIRSWYELGGILDRQGRYDEAMAAFLEAKSVARLDAPPHAALLKIVRGLLRDLRENLSAGMLQRWFDAGPAHPPARRMALLSGHPRSGTTLLEQVLDSHPDIVSAEETAIFHDESYVPLTRSLPEDTPVLSVLESAQTGALQQSRQAYFRSVELFLGQAVGSRLLIDKNPSLTFLIPHFVRIFPELKVLVALRDPRDVCLSCFMQAFFPLGQTSSAYLSLEGTVEEYAALMGMWRTVAPLLKNPWLEVRYEDMVNDLESVSRRTLDFLGVPWDKSVLRFDEHARQKTVRSPTYADVTKPVFKTAVGRWRNYQKYLEPHLEKLAPFVKAFGYE